VDSKHVVFVWPSKGGRVEILRYDTKEQAMMSASKHESLRTTQLVRVRDVHGIIVYETPKERVGI